MSQRFFFQNTSSSNIRMRNITLNLICTQPGLLYHFIDKHNFFNLQFKSCQPFFLVHFLACCKYLVTVACSSCGNFVRSYFVEYDWTIWVICACRSKMASSPIVRSDLAFLYTTLSNSVLFISTLSVSGKDEKDYLDF